MAEGEPHAGSRGRREKRGEVHALPWQGSDEELLARLVRRDEGAAAILFSRYGPHVNRMVWHILGHDPEHDDLVQDVFIRLLRGIRGVREASKLRQWVLAVTANTVRSELRRRKLRRMLFSSAPERFEAAGEAVDEEGRALLRRTFAVLEHLGANERLAFALRHVDGRPLKEVAQLCGCSLATVKRRLARAERRFVIRARRDPGLLERIERGGRFEGRAR